MFCLFFVLFSQTPDEKNHFFFFTNPTCTYNRDHRKPNLNHGEIMVTQDASLLDIS